MQQRLEERQADVEYELRRLLSKQGECVQRRVALSTITSHKAAGSSLMEPGVGAAERKSVVFWREKLYEDVF